MTAADVARARRPPAGRALRAVIARGALAAAASLLVAALLALGVRPALRGLGELLVEESPLAVADVAVVSGATAIADALEAGRLHREGYAPQVLVPGVIEDEHADELRRLGVRYVPETALIVSVLERSGVPRSAVHTLPDPIDGTQAEVAATAAFAAAARPRSLLVITARSHSARTAWLLRRALPAGTRVLVRSPRDDTFDPAAWWRSRWQTREVLQECLRWLNSAVGDLWRGAPVPSS